VTKYIIAPVDAKDGDDTWFWAKYLTDEQEKKIDDIPLVQEETENRPSRNEASPDPGR